MRSIRFRAAAPLAAALLSASPAVAAEDLVRHPISVGTFLDVGQLVHGRIVGESREGGKSDGQMLQRSGVGITLSATYREDLDLRASIGGLFWYSLPEQPAPHERLVKGGFGVGEVTGIYRLTRGYRLQFGLFGHKYNSDARNLGEYLFRSGTYPGTITTGGFELLNTAGYMAQGLRLSASHFDGRLEHDVVVYSERSFEPNYDLSPGYVFAFRPHPLVELGGGMVLSHFLAVEEDKTTPRSRENGYDRRTGLPVAGADVTDTANIPQSEIVPYTFKGTKLMGRVSLNPQAVLQSGLLGPEDLKVYAELAVLGWKNYPFFYEKRSERMPIMFGFNLPAFRLLDLLAVELEYYKSPFPENINKVRYSGYPIWNLPTKADGSAYLPAEYKASGLMEKYRSAHHSWRWTGYAKRSLGERVGLVGMVASDHTRPIHFFGDPDDMPFVRNRGDWYYALRLATNF